MAAICKQCGIRPSQIHYTEIVNDRKVTVGLCLECAELKGIGVPKPGNYGIGDLVASMIDASARSQAESIGNVTCATCGYDYSNFKKLGRFGCPDCYSAFEKQLMPLLRQLHGGTRHQGKVPPGVGERALLRQELADLRGELTRAIEEEAYEKAARLRDRIRVIEQEVEE